MFDPNNPALALKLDYVPLWLAKIAITPKMEQETPELAARLEQYQLKAKDVLAAATAAATASAVVQSAVSQVNPVGGADSPVEGEIHVPAALSQPVG